MCISLYFVNVYLFRPSGCLAELESVFDLEPLSSADSSSSRCRAGLRGSPTRRAGPGGSPTRRAGLGGSPTRLAGPGGSPVRAAPELLGSATEASRLGDYKIPRRSDKSQGKRS